MPMPEWKRLQLERERQVYEDREKRKSSEPSGHRKGGGKTSSARPTKRTKTKSD